MVFSGCKAYSEGGCLRFCYGKILPKLTREKSDAQMQLSSHAQMYTTEPQWIVLSV